MHQEDKDRMDKYLKGTAGIDEQARVEKMLASKGEVRSVREYVKSDWNEYIKSDEVVEKDFSHILDRIHHTIHLNESKLRLTLTRKIYRWYSAAAAIILIPLLIAGVISTFELGKANRLLAEKATLATITSPMGSRVAFQLPDGTEGVLNGGSSIEYPVPFTNNRDVKLIGEAYFDVERDEEHPFAVTANQIEVKVLGTRFNVNAYPDEKLAEVVLEEGKVECRIGKTPGKITMNPNERVRISGGKAVKTEVNAIKYTAWREGKLIFRGDSMDEVARRISRWYNVEVEIADKDLASYSFRATFEDDPLEEVLRLLKMTSPIDYKIESRKKLPDGSFSKKRVNLYKRR